MFGSFLSRFWQAVTATKNAIGNLLLIAFVIFILVSIFSVESESIPDSTALVINPTGVIVEQLQVVDPVSKFLSGYANENAETSLKDILDAIDAGAEDERIKLLVLNLDKLRGAGLSKLEEIGQRIDQFKQTGKPVYAFGDGFNQSQYFLASHADKVYINESSFGIYSGVFLTGIGTYPTYFKSALEKLKIKFNVYRVGNFKSAVEPYLRDNMSDDAKLSNKAWLNNLWHEYRSVVAHYRDISVDSFNRYTDTYDELLAAAGDPATLAIQYGLVDDTLSIDEWYQTVNDVLGISDKEEGYEAVGFRGYLTQVRPAIPVVNPSSSKVAVITASGVIYDGERPPGEIGSDTLSQLINQARLDDSVKALVLRVDSPGGSASASEKIRQALLRTRAAGKPVVVSMGSYAASGGYWIAAPANKIFATQTTITGSIGTFMSFPTLEDAAANFGIYSDGVGTTPLSGSLNMLKDVNPMLDNILQQSVNSTYARFIGLVAEGRELTTEQVDTLGQGRVWAATDALDHGLIDAIGGIEDAVASAALLADLTNYEVLYVEPTMSAKDRFLQELLNNTLLKIHTLAGGFSFNQLFVPQQLGHQVQELMRMSQSPGLYIQCLECKVSF